jgi:hypothetical protein
MSIAQPGLANPTETDITVIIPTYWTWPSSESHRPETAAYDHPTPLGGESTLPRLLDDLSEQVDPAFRVLVLTGVAHPELGYTVADYVRTLLRPYEHRLNLDVCDAPAWARLKAILEISGLLTEGLHLNSYSGIRNLQLLVPHILGAQVIIALDDDESIQPDYVRRSLRFIGQTINGQRVLGLAGPYLQSDGSVLLQEAAPTGNPLRDKGRHINAAMRRLTSAKGALLATPMALGGNMVFHHDLFTRVPFDPGITRGEDIDYLINARLQGIRWWFDAELTILHLPPRQHDTPVYQRMREDVFRFIYEREKLRQNGYNQPDWLDPYPGALLGDDLIEYALAALQAEATADLIARFGDPQTIVQQAKAHAAHFAPRHQGYAQTWGQMMTRLEQDEPLRGKLVAAIRF